MVNLPLQLLVGEVITEAVKIYRDFPQISYYEAIDKAKTILDFKESE